MAFFAVFLAIAYLNYASVSTAWYTRFVFNTTQQIRVVELILSGKQNKEIAAAMELSVHTIETYLKRTYARTNTDSRTNLAVHVLALGIQYLRSKIDK